MKNYYEDELLLVNNKIKSISKDLKDEEDYLDKLISLKGVSNKDLYTNISNGKYFSVDVKHNVDYRPTDPLWDMSVFYNNLKDVTVCYVKLNDKYFFHPDQIKDIIVAYIKNSYNTIFFELL